MLYKSVILVNLKWILVLFCIINLYFFINCKKMYNYYVKRKFSIKNPTMRIVISMRNFNYYLE